MRRRLPSIEKTEGGEDLGVVGGFVGLGTMERNAALGLRRAGHQTAAHDVASEAATAGR